jgi:TonB family protein
MSRYLRATALMLLLIAPFAASAADSEPVAMPRFVSASGSPYSAVAVRKGLQGSVVVRFRIDAKGRVRDLKETHTDHRDLGREIPAFLRDVRFGVPADWSQTGGPERSYSIEFQFFLEGPGKPCPDAQPAKVEGAQVMKVCRGDPIRRPA